MDEVVRLLRAQILISNTCLEKLKAIKTTIQAENKGANIAAAVQDMEPALLEMGKLEKRKQEFLTRQKLSSLQAVLASQPHSAEREIAVHLLHRAQEFEESLVREIASTRFLLEKGKKYVDFNINVMTKTVASDIYNQDAAESESRRGVKMFDSSV
ncbi:MAG: hypothetical protein E7201_03720 [Selenomonas ruminantium]|jgi:hypothetical protein|uniref:FlgN protein n=1 Tax=Selenomonas ruminantium TaxID=971 RepID=A0A927ZX70_SELRU|nr:hypothetical protein [Selenomonas ruminantium]